MKKYLFLLALALPMLTGFAMSEMDKNVPCPRPANVAVTSQGSGSISFDWDDCNCSLVNYHVSYVRQEDGYGSPTFKRKGSSISFSGLPSGTYNFYFRTDCGSNGVSESIGIQDTVIN